MKRIFHNMGLKILAVISALLLWATVVILQNVPYQFPEEFEVQAFNLPEHLFFFSSMRSGHKAFF